MRSNKDFSAHHISTVEVFATTKFAANADNSLYFVGGNTADTYVGVPDIKYEDYCIIKPYGYTYTHGRFNVQSISSADATHLGLADALEVKNALATKEGVITGAASTITNSNLTASKVLGSDANGKVAATSIATTDAEDAVSKRHTQNTDTQLFYENYGVGSAYVNVNGDEYYTYASMQANAEETAYINVGVVGDSANITLAAGNNAISIDATSTSIRNNVNIAGDLTLNNNVLTGSDLADAVEEKHTQNTDTQIVSGSNKVEVNQDGVLINGNTQMYSNDGVRRAYTNNSGFVIPGSAAIGGNLSISGNLSVTGKETVEEIVNIKSENNFITLRDGAQTAIASGSISGTKVENYDGLGNDLLFGTDASGTFRIGDDGGTLEPIATRDEASNLTNGQLMKWDATNQRLVGTSDISPQINSYVASKAMTEDAYWDLVTAGTVQADTLYITFDNDWEG